MNPTSIEWVKNPDGSQGYTWNPITGCLNHVNGICKGGNFPCYAHRLANTRLKERYLTNKNTATDNYDEDSYPFYPRFWPEKTNELPDSDDWTFAPSKGRNKLLRAINRPKRGIFTCDMSDLFGLGVPRGWTEQVMRKIRGDALDRFYLLTKQPQNLAKFSPFPNNAWVGVTACTWEMAVSAAYHLIRIEAAVRYISFEPLLEGFKPSLRGYNKKLITIDWVIIGGQTRPTKLPKPEWIGEIVDAADEAGIPVFLKNNLQPLFPGEKLRQEIPR